MLTVSPNGCFWKMPYPVSPYAYPRPSVPVSVLFSYSLPLPPPPHTIVISRSS